MEQGALGAAGVRRVGYGLELGRSGRGISCGLAHNLLVLTTVNKRSESWVMTIAAWWNQVSTVCTVFRHCAPNEVTKPRLLVFSFTLHCDLWFITISHLMAVDLKSKIQSNCICSVRIFMYRVCQNVSPEEFCQFFKNYKEVWHKILHTGYSFNFP